MFFFSYTHEIILMESRKYLNNISYNLRKKTLWSKRVFDSFINSLCIINPFDTSVLVCPFQVKISEKTFFLRFLWKVPYNLILIWRIKKSNLFFQIFLSSFSFLPRLVKNVLKSGSGIFFSNFHENHYIF